MPRLERLTNMYNRSTGDRATRFLHAHPTLVYYGAFGTQITDESLRILPSCPRLEEAAFSNCDYITDEGMRALAAMPALRRVSTGSCLRVTGAWLTSMPAGVEARDDGSNATYVEGYRARKLYINGELRHAWREDYSGVCSRIGISVQRSEITIRSLTVRPV